MPFPILLFINFRLMNKAYTRNPIAIGWMKLKRPEWVEEKSSVTKKDKDVIMLTAGIIQTNKVRMAKGNPPRLKPINVIVWVEVAPGMSWQNELISNNSLWVRSFLFSTKVRVSRAKWPWGPPNAETLCRKTAFKNGMCRIGIKEFNRIQLY